jgi:alkylation response protein AidB-like acyl-CoA dehydrogenase
MLCRSERASAVTWDATVAHGQSSDEVALAVAVAAAVALDAAVENAKDCIQVLGGIGFTWEHDAHLYLRRAVALRQLHGDGAVWRQRVARLAIDGSRRSLRLPADPASQAVRAAVREIAVLPDDERRAALADAGLLTPDWPRPYGLDATPAEQLAIDEELAAAGIARPDIKIAAWALPTIIRHGTDEQRERFVGPSLRGELIWCQLFSEPEAGSDLASLRTRAVRVDGGWLLTGQKVWTSVARQAHWGICLARSDADAPKHKGITYFLVAMDSPGLEIRPLREITGEAVFNEVFLDDVFVPDRFVVGAPGDGWRLARGTLENERVAIGRGSSLGEGVERLIAAVKHAGMADEQTVRDRVGGLVADGLAMSTLELRATLRRLAGSADGAESAVRKLVGVAQRQAVAETSLLLLGAAGAAVDNTADDAAVHQFLLTRCLSIAGGSTQILLSLVGERVLGLPREP